MRPTSSLRARERDKRVKWLRKLRERIQHFSLASRPQMVRAMWVRDFVKKEAQRLEELAV